MEAAGLAVGVVGLVGLFNTCLDAVDKASTYRSFRQDARVLQAQFNAEKTRLEDWGKAVGFDVDQPEGQTFAKGPLKDPSKVAAVKELLTIIREVCDSGDKTPRQNSFPREELDVDTKESTSPTKLRRAPTNPLHQDSGPISRRRKATWALWGKRERSEQVRLIGQLVQQLHNLVPPQETSRSSDSNDLAKFMGLTELRQVLAEWEEKIIAETRSDMHNWLMGMYGQHNTVFDDAVEDRLQGTCDWVLNQPLFSEWLPSERQQPGSHFLWMHGPAGFGKTIMCARIVQHLLSTATPDTPVAYFFFSSNLESRKDPFVAVRSWISQLMHVSPMAFDLVRERWETRPGPQQAAARSLIVSLFRNILLVLPQCTFVIDGLDECASTEPNSVSVTRFIEALQEALISAKASARILVVSRDDAEIREALTGGARTADELHLEELRISPEDVQSDTAAMSRNFVNRKLPNKNEDIKADISKRMSERCEGQFLWLKMQEESGILRKGMNQKQLQRAIDDIPTGLERIYERNWERICRYPDNERSRAFSLLRWTAFSTRPLTVSEVTEAVLITTTATEFPMDDLPDSLDDEYIDSEILGICRSLLEVRKPSTSSPSVNAGSRTVHLTHFSVKEFLLRNTGWATEGVVSANDGLRASVESQQNCLLAQLCLKYINYVQVWEHYTTDSPGSWLVDYAAEAWLAHGLNASGGLDDPSILELLKNFFDEANPSWPKWASWFRGRMSTVEDDLSSEISVNPLLHASAIGLCALVRYLIQEKQHDVNVVNENGCTPLILSCSADKRSTAKALLELGADVAPASHHGSTALRCASERGSTEIVRLLLEKGADIGAKGLDDKFTSLHKACLHGHFEIVELLLAWGASVEARSDGGFAPIQQASIAGHVDIVKLLISKGADIETQGDSGTRPLHIACIDGRLDVVTCLIEHGVDVKATDVRGYTPLCTAAANGHAKIAKLLVERAGRSDSHSSEGSSQSEPIDNETNRRVAYMNAFGVTGLAALHNAAHNGNLNLVHFLLDEGADVNAANPTIYLTPLHLASAAGHADVVRALLDRGADRTKETLKGTTAMICAVCEGRTEVVDLLLDSSNGGINSERRPFNHIMDAIVMDRIDMLKHFISNPNAPDIFAKDKHDRLAFFYFSAWYGKTTMLRYLLETRNVSFEEMNGRDCFGATSLLAAVRNGHVDTVSYLLTAGGNAPELFVSKDDLGLSALWWARYTSNDAVAELLLERAASVGLDIEEAEDKRGPDGTTGEAPRKRLLGDIDRTKLHQCDACTLPIPWDTDCYACTLCDGVDCDICEECVGLGIKVQPDTHKNVELSV